MLLASSVQKLAHAVPQRTRSRQPQSNFEQFLVLALCLAPIFPYGYGQKMETIFWLPQMLVITEDSAPRFLMPEGTQPMFQLYFSYLFVFQIHYVHSVVAGGQEFSCVRLEWSSHPVAGRSCTVGTDYSVPLRLVISGSRGTVMPVLLHQHVSLDRVWTNHYLITGSGD